jgi:DNA polymerase-3 subunit delta'
MLFARTIGHADLKARLIDNVREGRVAHAQLFLGPRGSGVLPLALGYARYLLCAAPGPADACGACPACGMVDKLAHPDLHLSFPVVLEKDKVRHSEDWIAQCREALLSEPYLVKDRWMRHQGQDSKQPVIAVGESQSIMRKLSLRAAQGGYRILLMWLPEFMNIQAANKLLKSLEEPEPGAIFLLVGHDAEHLLTTILSRVQLVKVPALALEEVAEGLELRVGAKHSEAMAIAARSEGDLLEALAIHDKSEEELFVFFRDWLRAVYGNKLVDVQEHMEYFAKMGRDRQKGLMQYGLYLLRQIAMEWQGVTQLLLVTGEEAEFVQRFARLVDEHTIAGMRTELERAILHVDRNANPKVLFLDLSYRMTGLLRAARQ